MSKVYIFEDNSGSPVSRLLTSTGFSCKMYFSSGNIYLLDKLEEVYNECDDFVIFIDCPPNRADLIDFYDMLCEILEPRHNIRVIPIICIEEVLLRVLRKYKLLRCKSKITDIKIQYALDEFDYEKLSNNVVLTDYEKVSLEHLYKQILNDVRYKCFQNKNSNDATVGLFYKNACNCGKFCNNLCSKSLREKSCMLYTGLPVFSLSKVEECFVRELGIDVQKISNYELFEKIERKYNMICKSMKLSKVCINKYNNRNK